MPTVMVVEDDFDFRELERMALTLDGYRVLTAGNGVEALALLKTEHPCVILLDLMMPVMDGLTFLRERGKMPAEARSVPVICVSAGGRDLSAEALRRGATNCLPKPTDIDDLRATVGRMCGRRS